MAVLDPRPAERRGSSGTVLITWPDYDVHGAAQGAALARAGLSVRAEPKLGERSTAEVEELASGAVAAIVSTDPFDAQVLAASPGLRVIARVGVGLDSIDLDAATEHGVAVTVTPGANESTVADHAVALMLCLVRRVVEHDAGVRRGEWNRTGRHAPGTLSGMTVGMSAGMLDASIDATIVCRFNDGASVREAFAAHADEIAAVIVEPIAHTSPSILPIDGFLQDLRDICDEQRALLIYDEVITGFRHGLGGYQAICGVLPDLTTFAKAIANGYPIAVVAGPRDLLERYNTSATGNVTFAGTYNGGAVPAAAALATIETLEREPVHEHIFALGDRMRGGLAAIASELGVPAAVAGYGSLYVMLFMEGPLRSYDDAVRNDRDFFVAYRKQLVRRGVFEMPENIGRNHISYSHTADDVDRSLQVARSALTATLEERGLPRGGG